MPTKVTVVGWQNCGYFQEAVQATTEAAQKHPDKLTVTHTQLSDRQAYQTWLAEEKPKLGLDGGQQHTSSPFVYLNDGQFLGGCDAVLAYLKTNFNSEQSKGSKESKGDKASKQMAIFSVVAALPLVVSSATHHPVVTAAGMALQAYMYTATLTPPPPSSADKQKAEKVEKTLIKKLVITSTSNRLARMGLGACNLFAAVAMARRWTPAGEVQTTGSLGLELVALMSLTFFSAVWGSSGYHGQ